MIPTASLLPDPPPRRRHEEEDLQRAVVRFLDLALPPDAVYFAVPNGGLRSKKAAARLKGMGVCAGVPDIAVLCVGLWIFLELKTERGRLSRAQLEMIRRLERAGAAVLLCRSLRQLEDDLRALGVPLAARTT
jgi:rhodanese-related sulfurtransferase